MPRAAGSASTASRNGDARYVLHVGIEAFKEGVNKFVAMFTESYGVRVIFRGAEAHTDGKTIVVPELSLLTRPNMTDAQVAEAQAFLVTTRGFVYHEGAHIMFSDMRAVGKAIAYGGRAFKDLVNVLEDVRIEWRIAKIYVGAKEALTHLNDWIAPRVAARITANFAAVNAYSRLLYALNCIGCLTDRGTENAIWEALDGKTHKAARSYASLVMKARNADSTSAVVKIAKQIWEDWKAEQKAAEPPPPPQPKAPKQEPQPQPEPEESDEEEQEDSEEETGDVGGEEDAGDAAGDEDGDPVAGCDASDAGEPADGGDGDDAGDAHQASGGGDDGGEADGEDGPADDEAASADGDGGKGDQPGGAGARDEDPEADLVTKEDLISEEALRTAHETAQADTSAEYRVYSTENDVVAPPPDPAYPDWRPHLRQSYKQIEDSVRFAFGPVQRELEALLKSRAKSWFVRNQTHGKLDKAKLHRLATSRDASDAIREQARHVFKHKVNAPDLSQTALSILIDNSGSMVGTSMRLARQTCVVLGRALDMVGVKFEVLAYTTHRRGLASKMRGRIPQEQVADAMKLYARFGGLNITEVKRFDERWQDVNWRVTQLVGEENNYDGESLKLAAQRILRRREQRKVIIVLCDGLPSHDEGESTPRHQAYLHRVVKEVRGSGIELLCISMACPAAEIYYKPNHVDVSDVSQLPGVAMQQIRQILLGNEQRRSA